MIFCARSLRGAAIALAIAFNVVSSKADIVWSGLGGNSTWTNPANWEGNAAPANDGTEQLVFRSAPRTTVLVSPSQSIRRLRFDFSSGSRIVYTLSGSGTALTLGSEGLEVITGSSPLSLSSASLPGGTVNFSSSLGLVLGASQTWTVGSNSGVVVDGTVSGTGRLTVTGEGSVELSGTNTYSGGTSLQTGTLVIENDSALGTGSVTVSGNSTISSNSGARTLANALNLNTSLLDLLPYGGDLRFNGAVTLQSNATLRNYGQPVYLAGAIGETGGARSLTFSGNSAFVLSGVNTYSGGTSVLGGRLFFSNATSIPASGSLSSSAQGYVGVGFNTGLQSGFVSKFSAANTFGTIGFDTSPLAASAATFAEPLDLSAFNSSARIGTSTRATFSSAAIITPSSTAGYRFGGGGGTLRVDSRLTGTHALTVDSTSSNPLTVYLTNVTNDYSGATAVTNSALVFGAGAASPNSVTGSYTLGTGGYIGTQDLALLPSAWIARFAATTLTGVIGFDSADLTSPFSVGSIVTPIDLTRFTGTGTSIALGTSSAATLAGTIVLPANQADYHLTGYKGGWLTITSGLSGAHGLRIGDASGNYPEYDPNDLTRISTVFLNSGNSHTGGTTLFSGRLVIGNAAAFGSGSVTIDGSGANVLPRLETTVSSNPTFSNQLVVKSGFEIGGANGFTWSGNIVNGTSTGRIDKYGTFNLTLSGNNSGFSGGFYIDDGTITFATDTAAGTGRLHVGYSTGIASFTSASPTLTSLAGESSSSRLSLGSGTTLTINQSSDTTFRGQIQGTGGIAKAGTGALRLTSAGTYTGGTSITAGTMDVAATGALGTAAVTLNGATSQLKLGSGVTLSNSIVFGGSGGRLSGHGTFASNVVVGTNTFISPGSSVGTLTFAGDLTLSSGSSYDFEVQNAVGGPGVGWDFVQVNGSLTFTATTASPFTLNLISLNNGGASGNPANFASSGAYSWSIASATSFVGFNSSAITLNTSGFTAPLNGGAFSLSTSGTNLLLNFTPVPEPSTWILFLTGAGFVALRALRRKR